MKKTLLATTALIMYGTAATAGQTFIDVPVINYNPIKTTSEIRSPVQNCTEQLVQVLLDLKLVVVLVILLRLLLVLLVVPQWVVMVFQKSGH